ncbi:hypothetical protein [Corynebacterium sp. AOP12-C2-36]|uniref:hypothetical protein n=1 Tax=Corynebacterium sp. AOP12-C2-36 TaxID=3457723 RepID=UPI004034E020
MNVYTEATGDQRRLAEALTDSALVERHENPALRGFLVERNLHRARLLLNAGLAHDPDASAGTDHNPYAEVVAVAAVADTLADAAIRELHQDPSVKSELVENLRVLAGDLVAAGYRMGDHA